MVAANDNSPAWPRGLRRVLAAAYIGVSLSVWDSMVAEGTMPRPKRFMGRTIWDKMAVDAAFSLLDGGSAVSAAEETIYEFAA